MPMPYSIVARLHGIEDAVLSNGSTPDFKIWELGPRWGHIEPEYNRVTEYKAKLGRHVRLPEIPERRAKWDKYVQRERWFIGATLLSGTDAVKALSGWYREPPFDVNDVEYLEIKKRDISGPFEAGRREVTIYRCLLQNGQRWENVGDGWREADYY